MNVCVIPARGGSRRIPRKNERIFCGHPIIYYSIKAAQESKLFSMVIVSTEDDRIGRLSEGYGATWYQRRPELAEIGAPDCGTQEVTADVLQWLKDQGETYKYACCVYPCAPMLTANDLIAGYKSAQDHFSYVYVDGWYYWGPASAFVARRDFLYAQKMKGPQGRWIDINTEQDWSEAERMYGELQCA